MFKEFKEFAMKGNVVDMGVGIVLGAAFGAVVTSFVSDLLMPPIGLLLGNVDFSNLFLIFSEGNPAGPYASLAQAQAAGAVTLNYGIFINRFISFLIVAFVLYLVIRSLNRMKKQAPAPAEPSTKECPFCCTTVSIKAVRCPNCTSDLKKPA